MDVNDILCHLKSLSDPSRRSHMSRYGINTETTLGISIYNLRRYAQNIRRNHDLALALWKTGIHEAKILACFVDDLEKITLDQMTSGRVNLTHDIYAIEHAPVFLTKTLLLGKKYLNGRMLTKNLENVPHFH